MGPHGLTLIGRADWNDCLNLNCFSTNPNDSFQTCTNKEGKNAESVMIAQMFVYVTPDYAAMCRIMGDEAEAKQREIDFAPFQVNSDLMSIANDGAIFMHCLPAIRGQEVTAEVIDGPQSVIFDEAENRMHAQKAVLYYYMKD